MAAEWIAMRWFAIVLATTACTASSPLTGDAESDLAALTMKVDVDCNAEPLCGPAPHCMTDALRAHQVATIQRTVYPILGQPRYYVEHLFTDDSGILAIYDERNSSSENPSIYENHCAGITAILRANNCWDVEASACDVP